MRVTRERIHQTNLINLGITSFVHEVCGSIRESKGHHGELKLSIPSHKSYLWDATLSNLHLMIARSEINLGEILGTPKLIKQIIDP